MKIALPVLAFFMAFAMHSQNLVKEAKAITDEGKLLYKSEMASWLGTDMFMQAYKDRANVGGYFSYAEGDTAKCIFFSKAENPKVIGTIAFDSQYSTETARMDLSVKEFSDYEKDLYTIRANTLREINSDTLFQRYENTSLNLIPLIRGKEKKVYILTGPSVNGVVIFGNDYLLTFDNKNRVVSKKRLHKNIIPIYYSKEDNETETIHSHLPETGDFITATDVCTIMLYEKIAKMKNHTVVSGRYMSTYNCLNDELLIVPMETIKKINSSEDK
jgi:hypothetical protein